MRPPRWTAAASALVLLAACSSTPDASTAPGPTADPSPTATPSPSPSPPADAGSGGDEPSVTAANDALDGLTGRQLDGGTFDGTTVTGDVVVWFWAPW